MAVAVDLVNVPHHHKPPPLLGAFLHCHLLLILFFMFGICVFNKKLSGMGEGLSEDNRWEKSNFFLFLGA